ncbi:MAG: hypothetical protein K2X47_12400 [Bdellovibrionales bacterium]|nr:hypothetical protein [Bdellovibrionales bacterium]
MRLWKSESKFLLFFCSTAILMSLVFQNCGKVQPESHLQKEQSGTTSGFPKWTVPSSFLPVATIQSEMLASLPASLSEPSVLVQTSGASIETMERYDLNTIRVSEVGTSGGFLQLGLLPDGRYRMFVFIKSSSYGLAYGQITREFGTYILNRTQLTLNPQLSETQTGSSSGAIAITTNSLKERSYTVYEAVFETPLSSGAQNNGYILRGPCPFFNVPATCVGNSSAEHRLQAMNVDL